MGRRRSSRCADRTHGNQHYCPRILASRQATRPDPIDRSAARFGESLVEKLTSSELPAIDAPCLQGSPPPGVTYSSDYGAERAVGRPRVSFLALSDGSVRGG